MELISTRYQAFCLKFGEELEGRGFESQGRHKVFFRVLSHRQITAQIVSLKETYMCCKSKKVLLLLYLLIRKRVMSDLTESWICSAGHLCALRSEENSRRKGFEPGTTRLTTRRPPSWLRRSSTSGIRIEFVAQKLEVVCF